MECNKIWWEILLGSAILGVAVVWLLEVSGVGAWLADFSDALWWEVLPWALLVVFWAVIGIGLYRQRRKSKPGS